jgi:hypothetical protein
MQAKKYILFAVVGVCGLISMMLIGHAYDSKWAGGQGYREVVSATISDTTGDVRVVGFNKEDMAQKGGVIKRGETLKTPTNTRAFVRLNGVLLFLDQRTDVTFERLFANKIELSVTRGRIALYHHDTPGDVTVKTNYTSTDLPRGGALTLVNFNFDETVKIVPLKNMQLAITHRSGATHSTTTPVSIKEIPMVVNETSFNPTGQAAAFYDWVNKKDPPSHK